MATGSWLRLLRRRYGYVPHPLCIHGHGTGNPANSESERDGPSNGGGTLQQLRESLPGGHPYRFVIHDRYSIFSKALDQGVTDLGVRVLRTPAREPLANSVCERFGGSLRPESLDVMIPFSEQHLKRTVQEWVRHYNRGRPHSALGPG